VDSLLSPVEVVSFQDYNKKVNTTPKKELKDLFFCRYFYSENVKEFLPLKIDYPNGHFNIEGFKTDKEAPIPKNWPNGLEYTQACVWRNIPEMIKDYLQSKVVPSAELRSIEENDQQLTLIAQKEFKQGTVVGQYTGYLCVNGEEVEENKTSQIEPGFLRILYEDDEVSVSVDASNSGNEYRFINDATTRAKPANVAFAPVQLDGKWHLIIVALRDIKVGDELVVNTKFKYWKENNNASIQQGNSSSST